MTRIPASPIVKIGEWAPDMSGLNTDYMNVVKNLISRGDRYVPTYGPATIMNALPSRAYGAVSVRDKGEVYSFAGTATRLYQKSTLDWADISRTSGGDYATATDGRWKFITYGERVFATNYADNVQTFNVGVDTEFSEAFAIKAKDMAVVNNFLVLSYTNEATDGEKAQRVRWSAIDAPLDLTVSAKTQSDFQDLVGTGGNNQVIIGTQNYALVFQERIIWRMDYVGSPLVFNFSVAEQNRGTRSAGSVVTDGAVVFYYGEDGFYQYDGQQSIAIGYGKVDKWFKDNLNKNFRDRISSSVDVVNKVYKVSFPSQDSVDGTPDLILCYCYATQRWSYIEQECEFIFPCLSTSLTLEEVDILYPSGLESIPISLDSDIFKGGEYIEGVFTTENKLGAFVGAVKEGYVEFGDDQPYDGQRSYITEIIPVTDADTVTVNVKYRDRLNQDYVETGDRSVNQYTGAAPVDRDSRYFNLCIKFSGDDYFTYADGFRYRGRPSGVR